MAEAAMPKKCSGRAALLLAMVMLLACSCLGRGKDFSLAPLEQWGQICSISETAAMEIDSCYNTLRYNFSADFQYASPEFNEEKDALMAIRALAPPCPARSDNATAAHPETVKDLCALQWAWNVSQPHCSWPLVECRGGHVTALFLEDTDLVGELPPELSLLPRLQTLDLGLNFLRGAIPPSLSTLTDLRAIRLYYNKFTGPVPTQFSALTMLVEMEIFDNEEVTGSLPREWSTLRDLSQLTLWDTGIKSHLWPEFSVLTNLRHLGLSSTPIVSDHFALPREWSTLTSMTYLSIALDVNDGEVGEDEDEVARGRSLPAEYSTWVSIHDITMHSSDVTGTLPQEWSGLLELNSLDLQHNRLTGTIPKAWSALPVLDSFWMSNNEDLACPASGGIIASVPPNIAAALRRGAFRDPCLESRTVSGVEVAIIVGAAVGGMLLLTGVIALVLTVCALHHKVSCKDPSCCHRHPGKLHSFAGCFGLRVAGQEPCTWCSVWSGHLDLEVDAAEITPYLTDDNCVASGGFGMVFRAKWRGQDVAVKAMLQKGPEAFAKLQEEVQDCRKFHGVPQIVQLLGACTTPPQGLLIMEFMPGGTLQSRIHSHGAGHCQPMELLEALRIARDVTNGLVAMHPEFVHRDIKPDNILLDNDGRAKIADLGLGRVAASPLDTKAVTDAAGTAVYMSPEQMGGQMTAKVDIYALGVVLNECLTAETPFSDYDHSMQVFYAVMERGARPDLPAAAPRQVKKLIEMCWAADPNTRPSARDLAFMLDKLIIDLQSTEVENTALLDRLHAASAANPPMKRGESEVAPGTPMGEEAKADSWTPMMEGGAVDPSSCV